MGVLEYFMILLTVLELSNRNGPHATASPPYQYGSSVFPSPSPSLSLFLSPSPSPSPLPPPPQWTFDVMKFGAVGDGKTDDSTAFELTWKAACKGISDNGVKISVPIGKKFLVSPIKFEGPCLCPNITFEILGSIIAQPKSAWKNKRSSEWIMFNRVEKLNVVGNEEGLIDGQGESWWLEGGNARPTAMIFSNCKNLEISGLKHINSPKFHISITDCHYANISSLQIIAPPLSPNTDGIDIASSSNIFIHNSTIKTGDDCIAIKGGTSNTTISEIVCGPGHGISIGSLGQHGKHDEVEGIKVLNCTLNGTDNGVRIKTWQGGSGFARNITFSNINFTAVENPIVIDQFYCPHKICNNKLSAVKVSNVSFVGIRGTSYKWKDATVSIRCSDTVPCTDILIDNVHITSTVPRQPVSAVCINARGSVNDTSSPIVNCLKY
ncbi:hypothetical protein ABFS82_09G093800 [Erythranthe guttata]